MIKIAITCPESTFETSVAPNNPPGANLENATKFNATALNINSRLITTRTALFFVSDPYNPIKKIIQDNRIKLLRVIVAHPYSQQCQCAN